MEFKVGDIVSFGGLEGRVIQSNQTDYSIYVKYPSGDLDRFTLDGKFFRHHKEPLLKLVSRPKKEVEKTIEVFANVYDDTVHLHSSEEDTKCNQTRCCLNKTNKKVKITYYTEE